MADTKPKPEQTDNHDLLKKRVDDMMDIKGPSPLAEEADKTAMKTAAEPKSEVAEVAASINENLAKSLSAEAPKTAAATAPVLPGAKPAQAKEEKPVEAEMQPAEEPIEAIDDEPVSDELKPPSEYDDPATNEAVDEIASKESDLVIAVEDAKRQRQNPPAEPTASRGHPLFWFSVLFLGILLSLLALGYAGFGWHSF
jgi:hypothetical protein